jgi:hypothetical protein
MADTILLGDVVHEIIAHAGRKIAHIGHEVAYAKDEIAHTGHEIAHEHIGDFKRAKHLLAFVHRIDEKSTLKPLYINARSGCR